MGLSKRHSIESLDLIFRIHVGFLFIDVIRSFMNIMGSAARKG